MFSIIMSVFLAAFTGGMFTLSVFTLGDTSEWCVGLGVTAIVVLLIFLGGILLGKQTCQIDNFSTVLKIRKQTGLYQQRCDELTAIIKTELAKYPEFEKLIIGDIKPQLLLNYPQLKSNETIVKMVNDIVALNNDIYELKSKMIEQQREILYRERSPWTIYVRSYEKEFGEANPLTKP